MHMHKKLLQDINGGLVIAEQFEELSREEAMKLYDHFKEGIAVLEKFLFKGQADAAMDTPAETIATDQTAAPADQNQPAADPAAPADPNQPAPADQSQQVPSADPNAQPAPAEQAAPQDTPVDQPAAPAVDANGNPVAPAPDPNAQSQEQALPPLQ